MTMQTTTYPHKTIASYLDVCCYNPDPNKLPSLLSENVSMQHKTNGTSAPEKIGKTAVHDAYCKYYFNLLKDLVLTESHATQTAPTFVELKIVGEKIETPIIFDKNVPSSSTGDAKRYSFIGTTSFTLIMEGNVWKIQRIEANMMKSEITPS